MPIEIQKMAFAVLIFSEGFASYIQILNGIYPKGAKRAVFLVGLKFTSGRQTQIEVIRVQLCNSKITLPNQSYGTGKTVV
jgi:hypothetical protein